MEYVKVNKYNTNEKINGHILSDDKMKEIGFSKNYYEGTDYEQYCPYWFYHTEIVLPKKYKGIDITFNIDIYKDTEEVRIYVLDEDFCQPYDYQYMLSKSPKFKLALIVKEKVEEIMERLQECGVISGHVYGEYI